MLVADREAHFWSMAYYDYVGVVGLALLVLGVGAMAFEGSVVRVLRVRSVSVTLTMFILLAGMLMLVLAGALQRSVGS
jgi:ribose/xylose/arabinose/galactoside ABC-type transport system permease subunit